MKTQLPFWLMPVIAVVGLVVLTLAVWQALTGFEKPVGKEIQVRPGMYNFREEMQKPKKPKKRGRTNGTTPTPAGVSL
jgi:hypothetical protein